MNHRTRRRNILMLLCAFLTFIMCWYFVTSISNYSVNLKVGRGFYSKEAVHFTFGLDAEKIGGTLLEAIHKIEKTDFIMISVQNDIRAVYFKGSPDLPPIVSGRFFSEEDFFQNQRLAVIGKDYQSETYKGSDNADYIHVNAYEYQVIGVMGYADDSSLDSMIMVNIDSLDINNIAVGRFFVDGRNNQLVFQEIQNQFNSAGVRGLSVINMPASPIDSLATGIVSISPLFILLVCYSFPNLIVVIKLWFSEKRNSVRAMSIVGYSQPKICFLLYREAALIWFAGFLMFLLVVFISRFLNIVDINYGSTKFLLVSILCFLAVNVILFLIAAISTSKRNPAR